MEETKKERVQFTRLTGEVGNVSGLIKLKRLGKIRLGLKKQTTEGKEYPSETEYFVCPPEVRAVYGEAPTELDAMFASNNPDEVYVEKLALYGKGSGLKCHGNGQVAERVNEQGKWEQRGCPCEFLKTEDNPKGQCSPQAHLCVILPKVSMWGYYQISTRSIYARGGILAAIKHLQGMVGRIAMIPLKLSRVPQEMTYKGIKRTHYIVGFVPDLSLTQIMEIQKNPQLMMLSSQYQLEPPKDENPEDDAVDVIEEDGSVDAEALANMTDEEMERVSEGLRQRHGQGKREPSSSGKPLPMVGAGGQIKAFDLRFDEVLAVIKESRTLSEIQAHVVMAMNLRSMKLNPAGQEEFINQFRAEAEKRGIDRLPF